MKENKFRVKKYLKKIKGTAASINDIKSEKATQKKTF